MTSGTAHIGTKQCIAAKLREIYASEDYQMVCAHCADVGDRGPDWADNIADLAAAELGATRSRPVVMLSAQAELDELPVGSVVMALWNEGPLHYVLQKYADGWYGFPSDRPVALLWRGGDKARPGVVVELPKLSLLICRGCMRYMDYCVKDPCDERAALLAAAAPAVRPGDNIYASNQAQADAVNRFIEREE